MLLKKDTKVKGKRIEKLCLSTELPGCVFHIKKNGLCLAPEDLFFPIIIHTQISEMNLAKFGFTFHL